MSSRRCSKIQSKREEVEMDRTSGEEPLSELERTVLKQVAKEWELTAEEYERWAVRTCLDGDVDDRQGEPRTQEMDRLREHYRAMKAKQTREHWAGLSKEEREEEELARFDAKYPAAAE